MMIMKKHFSLVFLLLIGLTNESVAQSVQEPATETYQDGIQLFEEGLYEEASGELEQFLAHHEDHQMAISARFYLCVRQIL